jgi:class 3 adenylate cyclase/tetratricopeptide (TPR) repeat protein
MTFDEVLAQVLALLQREGRVSYRALKLRFDIHDDYIEGIKDELIYAKKLAMDEGNRVLVWTGDQETSLPPPVASTSERAAPPMTKNAREPLSYTPKRLAEKILTSRSALEGERKQVTVLFCDLANSTPIAERIGPEAMHTLLNRFFEVALNAVHRYEGTINQFLGDGFMALFGAPIAHEDHARRAVLSALTLQHTLKDAELGTPYSVECQFRMGLNSGLVVVGSIGDNLRMDYSAIGDTTNLASRLQAHAAPGDILLSESTSRLVQGAVRLEALPPVQVKGKMEPIPLYKVGGTLPRRSPIASRSERTLSPFVGRGRELAPLEAVFAQVEAGHGQVVGIVAEAGGGKSRLLYEFRQRLQDKRVTYLEGRCLSYGSTIPYHPLIDVLRYNCGISETESPEAIIAKVHVALHEVGMDAEATAPFLLQLLGVKEGTESIAAFTPEAIRTRTFDALQRMSLQGSQQRPLIVEIEDLHWIDQTSEAYLSSLVESLTGASILLLTTYRPGYRPPWVEKSYATQVSLPNLPPQHAVTVIHSTKQQQALPAHLEQVIIGKAEGNPFFLEELTRAVIEHGAPEAAIDVPDTIQGVLSARIDRLSEASKRLLQTAAVLGREFAPALLQEMWEGSGPLEAVLLELKHLEFLYDRPGIAEPIYLFKHALTQEVAYDSLLTTRRQGLHTAAGHAMERLYPAGLADHYEELAHHFAQGEAWQKALDYSVLAGDRAAHAFANVEAHKHYTRALEAAGKRAPAPDPGTLARLHEKHAAALTVLTEYEAAAAAYQRALELIQQVGDRRGEIEILAGLSHVYNWYHRPEPALAYNDQALAMARELGDQASQSGCLAIWWFIRVTSYGQLLEAMPDAEEALHLARAVGDPKLLTQALFYLGWSLQWRADFDRGLAYLYEGAEQAERAHAGFFIGGTALQIGVAKADKGEYEEALRWYQRASDYAFAAGDKVFMARVPNFIGGIHLELFDLDEAIRLNLEGDRAAQQWWPWPEPRGHSLLKVGLAHLERGEHGRAEEFFRRAWALLEEDIFLRWRWHIPLLRARGELALAEGRHNEAWSFATQSLELATQTDSRKHVARAQRLQGEILMASGRLDDAVRTLEASVRLAERLQTPREVWLGKAVLGKVLARLGHEDDAAAYFRQAVQTIEALADKLQTLSLRRSFLAAEPVVDIYRTLGHRPPSAMPWFGVGTGSCTGEERR